MTAASSGCRTARLTAPGRFDLGWEPVPQPVAGSSLIRVSAVGLCGSDLHWYGSGSIGDAVLQEPLVLGHEIAGTVEGGPRHGLRVAVDPAIPCQTCPSCRRGHANLCPAVLFAGHGTTDGGLRELMTWPDAQLYPLPERVSDTAGAVLEPLGVAVHAVDLGHVRAGATTAVVGCGPIGLLLLQVLRAIGAGGALAVEPLAHRRAAALAFGADVAVGPDDVDGTGTVPEEGVDVAFEVTGSSAAAEVAMRLARPGGRVVLVGIPEDDLTVFPASLARRKGLTVALSRRMGEVYPRALRLVERGLVDVESLVTHRFALTEVAAAFRCAAEREGLKVLVSPAAADPHKAAAGGAEPNAD